LLDSEDMLEPREPRCLAPNDPWLEVLDLDAMAKRVETRFEHGAKRVVWRRWGAGRSVLLFHGGGGSWTHWLRTLPALMSRFTVWAPDLPGYGESDYPDTPHTFGSIADVMAAGAAELLEGDEPFDLATFSLGGQFAVPFANRFPGRLRKLVLVGSNVVDPMAGRGVSFKNWKKASTEAERDEAILANISAIMLHDPERRDDFAFRLHKNNLARQRMSPSRLGGGRSLHDSLNDLPPRVSLAGVNGANDFLIRGRLNDQGRAFHDWRSGAEFRAIEGGSHWVMYDAAEEFNRALLDLLGL
jgi:2-hydroxy-6-oxonona-2,4-dienedioate hydrolase